MEQILSFLNELRQHNERSWFEAHKAEYQDVQHYFNDFVADLLIRISAFDPSIQGLNVSDCTYRIYRDIRFSYDKSPYKTHLGAYVCPGGKKSGYAGYYFHLEPEGDTYLGGSLLACGLYKPEKEIVQSIREEILDHGQAFDNAIKKAKGFSYDTEQQLKKMPKGFPNDAPFEAYLRLKDFSLSRPIPASMITRQKMLEFAATSFQTVYDYNTFVNRAIAYVYDNKKQGYER